MSTRLSTVARVVRVEVVVFAALFAGLFVVGRELMLNDPGTLWHVRVGHHILEHGLIRADPFSASFAGQPWVPHQWLAEVGVALVYDRLGWDGLFVAALTLIAGTFAYLAGRLVAGGLHPLPAVALVALAAAASAGHMLVRPHWFTVAWLAVTVVALADYEAGRARFSKLVGVVASFALWANLHGGVLAGIGSVVVVVSAWLVAWALGRPSPVRSRRDAALHLGLVVLALATALATPYGLELPRMWGRIVSAGGLARFVVEHAPPPWGRPLGWLVIAVLALAAGAVAGVPWRQWRPTWPLLAAWGVQAVSRYRHVPLFAATLLALLPDILAGNRWAARLAAAGSDLSRAGASPRVPWVSAVLPTLLVALAALATARGGWARPHPETDPLEVLPALQAVEQSHPNAAVFNDYNLGGFVLLRTPGLRPVIDDRYELYGDDFTAAFLTADAAAVRELVARYDCRAAVFVPGSDLESKFRTLAGWREAARCPTAVVYVPQE